MTECGWNSDIQEQLLQFSFQLTRCNESVTNNLSKRLESILSSLISNKEDLAIGKYQELMITAYKLIGYTRDIICGKGEYTLAYMQILVWYKFYPELAKYALNCFLQLDNINSHPYGSWKDIKYFCNYCKNSELTEDHPLIDFALVIATTQLRKENEGEIKSSLISKWIPREKSKKFGWLYDKLAILYFPHYFLTAYTGEQKIKALLKAKTEYRRIISKLNAILDTVQIKQCSDNWSKIDHEKTTSITMMKQKSAFLNFHKNEDREQCAKNLVDLINTSAIKGKRISMNDFAKDAICLLKKRDQNEIDLLNSQWKNNSEQTDTLRHMIAIIDCGDSMYENPFYSALAIGCRIAEKSILGKRLFTFGSNTRWHNLEMCDTFTKMIECITNVEETNSGNFEKVIDMILEAIIDKKLSSEEASGMTLVILSDMATNKNQNFETMYDTIKCKYSDAGIKIGGKSYNPPHILFWNLQSTNTFPCPSTTKNVSMVSGFTPSILETFYEERERKFIKTNPWFGLIERMKKNRYLCLEEKIKKELAFYL